MKEINGYLLCEVPEDSCDFTINDNRICYYLDRHPQTYHETLYHGNYSIIGLAKDLSEEQWCEIFGTEYDAHCYFKQNKLSHNTTLILKKENQ